MEAMEIQRMFLDKRKKFRNNGPATPTNVIKLSSSDLLRYDKLRRGRGLTWKDVMDGEEMEPDGESPFGEMDSDTHIRISNCRPVWQELFHVQRKSNLAFCDVHLITDEGYIPVHSAFLRGLSPFLDSLLPTVNTVSCKYDVLSISLPEIKMSHLKAFLTLVYTGSVVMGHDADENDIRNVIKLLHIEQMSLKSNPVNRDRRDGGRKMKSKLVRSYRTATDSDGPIKEKESENRYGMTKSAEPQTQSGPSSSASSAPKAVNGNPEVPRAIPSLPSVKPSPSSSNRSGNVTTKSARKRGRGRPRKSSDNLAPNVSKTGKILVVKDDDKDESTSSQINLEKPDEEEVERPIRTLRQAMTAFVNVERMTDEKIRKLKGPSPRQNMLVGQESVPEVLPEPEDTAHMPESLVTLENDSSKLSKPTTSSNRMSKSTCNEDGDENTLPSHQSKVSDEKEEMTYSPDSEPEAHPPTNYSKPCMKNPSAAKRKVNNECELEDEDVDAFVKRLRTQILSPPTKVNDGDADKYSLQIPSVQSQSQFVLPTSTPSLIEPIIPVEVKEEKKPVVNAGLQLMLQKLTTSLQKVTSVPSPNPAPFHDRSMINQITDVSESGPLVPVVEKGVPIKPFLETPPPSSSSRQSEDNDNDLENVVPEEQVTPPNPSYDEQAENLGGKRIKLEDQDQANNENRRILDSFPASNNIAHMHKSVIEGDNATGRNEFDPRPHPKRAPLLPTPIIPHAPEQKHAMRHVASKSENNPFVAPVASYLQSFQNSQSQPSSLNPFDYHQGKQNGQNEEIWAKTTTSTSHPNPSLSRHRNRKGQRDSTRIPPILPLMHPSLIVPAPPQTSKQRNPFIFGQAYPFQHHRQQSSGIGNNGHSQGQSQSSHPFLPLPLPPTFSRGHHKIPGEEPPTRTIKDQVDDKKKFAIYR